MALFTSLVPEDVDLAVPEESGAAELLRQRVLRAVETARQWVRLQEVRADTLANPLNWKHFYGLVGTGAEAIKEKFLSLFGARIEHREEEKKRLLIGRLRGLFLCTSLFFSLWLNRALLSSGFLNCYCLLGRAAFF